MLFRSEKAYALAEEKKKAINPFGRLVNMDELDKRSDEKFRKLTQQEQFEDRNEVHRIVKDGEQAAAILLATLRDRIGPMITRINQSFSQSEDPRMLMREFESLPSEISTYERVSGELRSKVDELKAHEEMIRK